MGSRAQAVRTSAPVEQHRIVTKQHAKTARKGARARMARERSAPLAKKPPRLRDRHLATTAPVLRLAVTVHAHRVPRGVMLTRTTSLALRVTLANTGLPTMQQARAVRAQLARSRTVASLSVSPAPQGKLATQAFATLVSLERRDLQTTQQPAQRAGMARARQMAQRAWFARTASQRTQATRTALSRHKWASLARASSPMQRCA